MDVAKNLVENKDYILTPEYSYLKTFGSSRFRIIIFCHLDDLLPIDLLNL